MNKQNKSPKVHILPLAVDISVEKGVSLLDLGLKNKIPIMNSCGGSGSCGTCRVLVLSGMENLPPRNDLEQAMAEDRSFAANERLSCQIEPTDDLVVEFPYLDSEDEI